MPSLPVVVSMLAAGLISFSRVFTATRPVWNRLPSWLQVLAPSVLAAAGAIVAGLANVGSSTDLTVAIVGGLMLLAPGAPSNRSSAPLQIGKEPATTPSAGDFAVTEAIVAKASVAPPPMTDSDETPKWGGPSSVIALLLAIVFAAHSTGCALLRGPITPKTIDTAAVTLCDLFYKEQKPGMSLEDIERAFCATAEALQPFLLAAKHAEHTAGEVSLHRSEVVK